MKATNMQSAKDAGEDISWRHFPQFELLLSQERPAALLAKVETTCRQLNEVFESGTEAEQTRAKLAMTAYGRSLDLLRLLTEMRDQAHAPGVATLGLRQR